jgi:hypothetical protein
MTDIHVEYPGGLDEARVNSKNYIDAAAGEARARYITIAPGQAETYTAKAAQAEAYLAAGAPGDLSAWHWIRADAQAFGMSGETAASSILANRDAWVQLGAHIEEIRLRAKAAVNAASSPMECARVLRAAKADLEAL